MDICTMLNEISFPNLRKLSSVNDGKILRADICGSARDWSVLATAQERTLGIQGNCAAITVLWLRFYELHFVFRFRM